MIQINDDWSSLLRLFLKSHVEFLVVGGIAVSAYGYSRYTKDLDLWVRPSPSNAEKIIKALGEFFESDIGFREEQFSEPGLLTKIGKEPFRVDIITSISGVDFESAIANHSLFQLGVKDVPFIGLKDLITAKEQSGRPQDLADIAMLKRRNM